MGGLINLLPFSYAMILIASLALMGFPFLSGYYSKDVIIETAYAKYSVSGHFAFWLGSISAMFTSFYSMRLIFLTFLGEVNSTKKVIENVHDAPLLMAIPMFILSFCSIFVGYLTRDIFIGLGSPFWGNSIAISPADYATALEAEFLPFSIKIIPILFSTFGACFAIVYYSFFFQSFDIYKNYYFYGIYNFLNKKWYIDKIYNEFIIQHVLSVGYTQTYKVQDRGFFEILGPTGLTTAIYDLARRVDESQTGRIQDYAGTMVGWAVYVFLFYVFAFDYDMDVEILILLTYFVTFSYEFGIRKDD